MQYTKLILAAAFVFAVLPAVTSAQEARADTRENAFQTQKRLALHLDGPGRILAEGEVAKLIRIADRAGVEMDPEVCFEVPLKALESGLPLGRGFSCLEQIVLLADGSFFTLVETGLFFLKGGKLVVQGELTGGALLNGDNDPATGVTHVTGSFPTENNVFGTGIFKQVTGRSRVSGGVNASDMENQIFNCIFVVDFEAKIPDLL